MLLRPSFTRSLSAFTALGITLLLSAPAFASHISGIRITQTGNAGLMINVDITAFYTTGETEPTAYLGTYYNQIPAIDWGDGNTTPRYGYGPSTGIPLVATSTVVNGIPARAYRGSFSHTYGSGGNYSIAANTRCCPLTTPTYTLVSGSIQTATISTTGPFGPTTFNTTYVQNTLDVAALAPGFSKAFAPSTVPVGVSSTLTFAIDNTASTLDNSALDFTDILPAGLVVAPVPNTMSTCTGGTLTAVAGTAVVSYTGGAVDAGSTCTLSVDIVSSLPGSFINTTLDLTSAFGNSGTASDTLTATANPATVTKAFDPEFTGINVPSTLTLTLDNSSNAAVAPSVDLVDNFPAGITVADPANASITCIGGTLTAVSGAGSISYSGGSVPAAATCTISVDTVADSTGTFDNETDPVTSAFGAGGTASATLTVGNSPILTKIFEPNQIVPGEVALLTFSVDNTANPVAATDLAFEDFFPMGMQVSDPLMVSDGCGGTLTAAAGDTFVTYLGGTVAASATCDVSVEITVTTFGEFLNEAGQLTSSLGMGESGTAIADLSGGTILSIPTAGGFALAALAGLLGLLALANLRRS